MVAGGVPVPGTDHAEATTDLVEEMPQQIVMMIAPSGESFPLGIGINSGLTVAGGILRTEFADGLWEETVATAWELATKGAPGKLEVHNTTEAGLRGRNFLETPGEYYIRDKGTIRISFLKVRTRRIA